MPALGSAAANGTRHLVRAGAQLPGQRRAAGDLSDAVVVPLPGLLLTNDIYRPTSGLGSAVGSRRVDLSLGEQAVREGGSLVEVAERLLEGVRSEHGRHARVVLVGHSYGGYAALEFAKRFPEQLAGLVLVSTQVRADTPHVIARRQDQLKLLQSKGLEAVLETISPYLISTKSAVDPELFKRIRAMALSVGPEVFERQVLACSGRADHRQTLRRLPAAIPVLEVSGKEDKITTPKVHQEMKQLLKDRAHDAAQVAPWRSAVLPRVGHLAPLEQPEAFQGAVAAWGAEVRAAADQGRREEARPAADLWGVPNLLGGLVSTFGADRSPVAGVAEARVAA